VSGNEIRAGVFLSGQHPPGVSAAAAVREHLEQVALARELGLASVWAGQHFLSHPFQMFQSVPLLARMGAKVVLEVTDQKMSDEIKPVMPRVMDAFQTYLRELRPTDLDGSAGLYRLKEELTRRVNAAIAPGRINAVLFKEIVVQ